MKIKVDGMSCGHCKANVERALSAVVGVKAATADFKTGEVTIDGTPDINKVREAIEDIGFDFAGEIA